MAATRLLPLAPTPLADSLPRLRTLVSPYTGIVTSTAELLSSPDDSRLVKIACHTADFRDLLGVALDSRPAGTGPDPDVALAAALGEAAERYSACWLPQDEFVLATADELGPEAVAPGRFALFSEAQYATRGFAFEPFVETTRVLWTRGFRLPDAAPAYLPVQLVYMPFAAAPGETLIGYTNSNGTACGPTLEEAIVNGLLELVERDAFFLAWYNRLSLPLLDWSGDPELEDFDARYFRPSGLRYAAVDLSAFWDVPTVAGVVRTRAGTIAPVGVGAAAGVTVAGAWRSALSEASSVRSWVRRLGAEGALRPYRDDFADIETLDDHVAFYGTPENAALTGFLDASRERRATDDVPPIEGDNVFGQIEAITRRLAARGVQAYAVDVTAPDVRAAGLFVAKVVAPELVALDVPYGGRFLGGRRLYEAAHDLGLVPAPLGPNDLNPLPHPFP